MTFKVQLRQFRQRVTKAKRKGRKREKKGNAVAIGN